VKRVGIDVELEIPYSEIIRYPSQEAATELILGKLRHAAEGKAAEAKGELVTTVLPEIVIKRTSSILLGGDLLLVAARWMVDVPESFVPVGR
jgi:hypothetical protein